MLMNNFIPDSDWRGRAKQVFKMSKPEHFTNYNHCCECFEHDEVLRYFDIDSIGLQELGNAAWDPICFSSTEGAKYYMPALIRLTLDNIENQETNYLGQFLFHLMHDGTKNSLLITCNAEQRKFIADFLGYLIENYSGAVDNLNYSREILRTHEIWNDC